MRIDEKTLYKDFAPIEPFMAPGEKERLEEAAVRDMFGDDGFMRMTLCDMLDVAMRGKVDSLLKASGETVFDVYRVTAFARFLNNLIRQLQGCTLPVSSEDVALRQGTLDSTFEESVYTFCRSYFQLPAFADVDNLKVADYLLAKRDDYNRGMIERNAAKLMKGGRR